MSDEYRIKMALFTTVTLIRTRRLVHARPLPGIIAIRIRHTKIHRTYSDYSVQFCHRNLLGSFYRCGDLLLMLQKKKKIPN